MANAGAPNTALTSATQRMGGDASCASQVAHESSGDREVCCRCCFIDKWFSIHKDSVPRSLMVWQCFSGVIGCPEQLKPSRLVVYSQKSSSIDSSNSSI